MSKVTAIAINTFKEAVRNRVLYVLLFFSILIMLGAWVASTLAIDDETRIVRDLGVGAINIISVLIAVFVGIGLVYNDLDKKTIYTIISKPISRWQFLLGKYFGLMLTITVNVLFMTWIFSSVLHFRAAVSPGVMSAALNHANAEGLMVAAGPFQQLLYVAWAIAKSLGLGIFHLLSLGFDGQELTSGIFTSSMMTILEMSVITSFAVLFSSFSTPTLSAFLTVIVFIIGRLNQDLYDFAQAMAGRAGGVENLAGGQLFTYYFATFSAYICPNLDFFNVRPQLTKIAPINIPIEHVAYGIVYTTLIIVISIIIFNRRNFK